MRLPKEFSDWIQLVVVVVVVLSLVGSTVTYFQTMNTEKKLQHTTGCLARYNDANQRNLLARSELARRQIDNVNALFAAFQDPKVDGKAVYQHYLAVQADIDHEKTQNPIPPPPSEVC